MTITKRIYLGLALIVLLASCTTPPIRRVALLAPFEGRYREIGYQALYAARIAIAEGEQTHLELLAVDDGGTPTTAQDRARALSKDPLVEAVLLLGPYPTNPDTVALLRDDQQAIVLGDWADDVTPFTETNAPITCADLCQLTVFAATADNLNRITVVTTAPPVTEDFATRYTAFDPFVPPPLPLARLTYETTTAWLRGEMRPTTTYRYTYTPDGLLALQP